MGLIHVLDQQGIHPRYLKRPLSVISIGEREGSFEIFLPPVFRRSAIRMAAGQRTRKQRRTSNVSSCLVSFLIITLPWLHTRFALRAVHTEFSISLVSYELHRE